MWDMPVDNTFAHTLFKELDKSETYPQPAKPARLCGKCDNMDFSSQPFRFKDTLAELERQSSVCDFCRMRLDVCKNLKLGDSTIYFDRLDSTLRVNESYPPVFSLCRTPSMSGALTHPVDECWLAGIHIADDNTDWILDQEVPAPMLKLQIGFPELPKSGGNTHIAVLRSWLKHCDDNHVNCKPPDTSCLPTRLLDVGPRTSPTVKIYETQPTDSLEYLALSHPWGKPPHFCTFRTTLEQYKQKIEFSVLPDTFQHAITITRELGLRYLWIDSLCIIQGWDGDFKEEAKTMEDVYSKAYCVLAVSSAKGQNDGFLKPRTGREYLTFQRGDRPPLYVCRFLDDFNEHVLESPLNHRGWVLQERALAKRTIYFTDKQTYWECGDGVRCETLTKMHK